MDDHGMTFGEELRRFRQRRGISQFDLAVCMEWKGTNPVIQIEKDRRVPQPETIERLANCLGLNYLEVHYLNGLAGYIPPTRLPPRDHVIGTLDYISGIVAEFPYPAYVIDYHLRLWMANPATTLWVEGDADRLRELMARPLNVFDIIFDSRLGFREHIEALEPTDRDQIFRFKATNAFRQHEPFYCSLPRRMNTLLPDDYAHFERLWNAIDINTTTSIGPAHVAEFYARIERGDLTLLTPDGPVAFHLRVKSILHLGDLFVLVMFVPVISAHLPDNKARAEAFSHRYANPAAQTLRLWDLIDIDTIFSATGA
jgi:transcriptional regulator with XRE-family HTH domain